MRLANHVRLLLIAFFLFACWAPSVMGQSSSTGALSGTVTDSTGAVVPNVTVTATSLDNGQVRTTTTGGNGSYQVSLLPPGNYRVKFEAPGFQAIEVPSVTVSVTETGTLNQTLTVGAQTQEVTVQADVETVQTSNATMGTVIGTKAVTDLPLNTRNYTNLLSLSGGANASVSNASAIGKGSQSVAANGGTALQNNYQMDGVSVVNTNSQAGVGQDTGGTEAFIGIPNPDMIEEFKIQTSLYDAGYGRNPGANVNVVTKSGTNAFHGTAFEFLRNTIFNANDWFLNRSGKPRGVLNQNQFGGVVGGPVKKDKLFFFVGYQETQQKNGIASGGLSSPILPVIPSGARGPVCSTSLTTVAACEAADLTLDTTNFVNALLAHYCNNQGATKGVAIQAPSSGPCTNPAPSGTPATAPINPVALRILQLQLPGGGYYVPSGGNGVTSTSLSEPAIYHEHQGIGNWDYIINDKQTFSGRYFYSIDPTQLPFGNGAQSLPGFPESAQYTDEYVVLKLTSIISTNLVNQFNVAYQRYVTNVTEPALFTNEEVGITPLNPDVPHLTSAPIGGFTIGAYTFGDVFITLNQYDVADQISWSHGKQTIRAGFEFADDRRKWHYPSLQIGGTTYPTFQDFLLGLPGCTPGNASCTASNPGGTLGNPATNGTNVSDISTVGPNAVKTSTPTGLLDYTPMWNIDGFVQDDIRLNSRLTINAGLRWEYDAPLIELNGKLTNIQPTQTALVPYPVVAAPCTNVIFPGPCAGGTYVGYVIPKNYNSSLLGPVPQGVLQSSHNYSSRDSAPIDNFAPRVGFAWQPLTSGRVVVRGGFGYFYDRLPAEDYASPASRQSPYALNEVASGTAAYFASAANPFSPVPVGWVPRWYTAAGQSSNILSPQITENAATPLVYEYNLGVQYQFAPSWVLELGYVGSHGIHQWQQTGPRNPAQLATAANPVNCGYDGVPTDCITTTTSSNSNLRVPYLGIASSDSFAGPTDSIKYNSLQATVRKQLSHGFTFQGAYSWSRAFLTTYVGVTSDYPVSAQYAPNPNYHPQRLALNYNWDLPFGHADGLKGKLIEGWSVSGVTTIQDGTPLTLTDTRGGTAIGSSLTSLAQYAPGMGRANVPSGGSLDSRVNGYFNNSAFTLPQCLTPGGGLIANPGTCPAGDGTAFGDSSPGIVLGPPQDNWDISFSKMTTVGGLREDARLQFRAEFFNTFNHPQFSNPAVAFSTLSTFGKITSLAVNPRLVQFGLKYIF